MALKAADFIRVDDDTSAPRANESIKIGALQNDPILLPDSLGKLKSKEPQFLHSLFTESSPSSLNSI